MKEILIADDEEIVRTPLRMALERAHYHVSEAVNGLEVMDILKSQHIDLLILDIAMPEKSGVETLIDMQKEYAYQKVILMTGAVDTHQRPFVLLSKHYHAIDVLEKPFDLQSFLKAVEKALR